MSSNLIRGLIPAVLAAAALWSAGGIAKKAAKQNASTVWPATQGVVVESGVTPGGTSENIVHDFAFRVVYQTRGGTYELDRVTRFGRLGTYFRGGPNQLAEAFQSGDVVMVHYNPVNHSESVVGVGLTRAEMFSSGAIILALVAVGLASALAAAEPFLRPMVNYQPIRTSTSVGQFNRGANQAKPRPLMHV